MGNYLLCKRPLAAVPLYIGSIHLHLYSLEELCFFLQENLALAGEVLENPALPDWLSEECGLKKQMREYEAVPFTKEHPAGRLNWIFTKSHYFTDNELRRLRLEAEALDTMHPVALQKKKGDALFRFGKYKHCIESYKAVFRMDGADGQPTSFTAAVWYNMGCAFMRLFESRQALECFGRADEKEPCMAYKAAMVKAVWFASGGEKMEEKIRELDIPEKEAEVIRQEVAGINAEAFPQDMDAALKAWVDAYHASME